MTALHRLAAFFAVLLLTAVAGSARAVEPTQQKKIAILVFDGVQLIDFSGPFEVFSDAGYDVFTVAATRTPIRTAAGPGMTIVPRYTFDDAPPADVVVIPGGDFEAAPGSPTSAWVKQAAASAGHALAVCNGAFTLASTGLLDGLEATTTAGNIARLQRAYPQVSVVRDRRVVDNGRILATGGLSAGIDGALRLVEVFDGHDVARSIALFIEYDWRPDGGFVRAALADRVVPRIDTSRVGETSRVDQDGDEVHWRTARRIVTARPPQPLMDALTALYRMGYDEPGPWAPNSFRVVSTSAVRAEMRFDDRAGHRWRNILTIESDPEAAGRSIVRLATDRVT